MAEDIQRMWVGHAREGEEGWASTAPMEIFGFKVDSPWSQIGTKVNPRRLQPASLVNCFLDVRDSSRGTPPPFHGMCNPIVQR